MDNFNNNYDDYDDFDKIKIDDENDQEFTDKLNEYTEKVDWIKPRDKKKVMKDDRQNFKQPKKTPKKISEDDDFKYLAEIKQAKFNARITNILNNCIQFELENPSNFFKQNKIFKTNKIIHYNAISLKINRDFINDLPKIMEIKNDKYISYIKSHVLRLSSDYIEYFRSNEKIVQAVKKNHISLKLTIKELQDLVNFVIDDVLQELDVI